MTSNIVLILPHQLFKNSPIINSNSVVYIYEYPFYFTFYKYHKLKLILHRSSMKYYNDYLIKNINCKVKYIDYSIDPENIFSKLKNKTLNIYDPVDHDILNGIKKYCKKFNINLVLHETLLYISTKADLDEYIKEKGIFIQTSFYIWQRKKLNILINNDGKPIGGKWTYDNKNRHSFDPKVNDQIFKTNSNKYVADAIEYVNHNFPNNIGSTDFYLPCTHKEAEKHLNNFIKTRLSCFGYYQDSVDKNIVFGCHSVLSPLLNIGLLTQKQVIDKVIKFYEKHTNNKHYKDNDISKKILYSVEAFIRQIIGWNNFMRLVYTYKHGELIKSNYFKHTRKLNSSWYNGTTNIEPIDDIIKKVIKYGYAHHIERLMYLSNFMLLSQIKPKDIYDWFMTMFIDSYPIFMETNVYGMSQWSSGNIMTTRPYFSSSNYIKKYSNYKLNKSYKRVIIDNNEYNWYDIWDALYYFFIYKHKKNFSKNYSTANAVNIVMKQKNSNSSKFNDKIALAKKYLTIY